MNRKLMVLPVLLLLTIACGAGAQGEEPKRDHPFAAQGTEVLLSTPTAPPILPNQGNLTEEEFQRLFGSSKPTDHSQVALLQRVKELEAQLNALRWTEQDAILVVQHKLYERMMACGGYPHVHGLPWELENIVGPLNAFTESDEGGCWSAQDPVLKAFSGAIAIGIPTFAKDALYEGQWSAVYQPTDITWRVESTVGKLPTYTFYAYERTGLVVGETHSPAQESEEKTLSEEVRRRYGGPGVVP